MTTEVLARARAGDQDAFRQLTEPHRRELQAHCYRILGSAQDAEDALQETLLAAWRGLGGFEERSSVRTWLYRVATSRCLNALRAGPRRPPVSEPVVPPTAEWPEPSRLSEVVWLEPFADFMLDDVADVAPGPRRATRPGRRSRWRSSPPSSTYHHASGPYSCSETSSVTAPPRWPTCSSPPKIRSTVL